MKAELCDNCKAAAPESDELARVDWVKVGKFVKHDGAHTPPLPPGMPPDHPFAQMLAQVASQQGGSPHACLAEGSKWLFCSDSCAAAFISNGYKPDVEALFKDMEHLSPADFVDSVPPDPEA